MLSAAFKIALMYLSPGWPAPKNIHAHLTTRSGGFSKPPYSSFNLADHVGDDHVAVQANRDKLCRDLCLPGSPIWLKQTHSTNVADLDYADNFAEKIFVADASFTAKQNKICAVLTADCLPILLCDKKGTVVSAIHAGWKGLAEGIIEIALETIYKKFALFGDDFLAWLGPAIGPGAFAVKNDVRDKFLANDSKSEKYFLKAGPETWLADIYALAKLRLNKYGITDIFGGEFCTFTDQRHFFSYRREKLTGRMASLIWLSSK